jgi:hypothetical protein
MLSGWTFPLLFVFMRSVTHNVVLNGDRSFPANLVRKMRGVCAEYHFSSSQLCKSLCTSCSEHGIASPQQKGGEICGLDQACENRRRWSAESLI